MNHHHIDELAAYLGTERFVMVSDDAFAEMERQAAASDRLRSATARGAEGDTSPGAAPVGVAVTPEWPAGRAPTGS